MNRFTLGWILSRLPGTRGLRGFGGESDQVVYGGISSPSGRLYSTEVAGRAGFSPPGRPGSLKASARNLDTFEGPKESAPHTSKGIPMTRVLIAIASVLSFASAASAADVSYVLQTPGVT